MIRLVLLALVVLVFVAVVLVATRRAQPPAPLFPQPADDPPPPSREQAITRARAHLEVVETRYADRVREAEGALAGARQDVEVLSLGPVVLGRCTVLVEGREHELTPRTWFELGQAGDLVYGAEQWAGRSEIVEHDGRTGTLLVSGEDWQEAVDVLPAQFLQAQRLVAAGRTAARTVDEARQERSARVEQAWHRLEQVRADRADVDRARLTLEDLQGPRP